MTVTIHQGDALAVLRTLPSNSVHCVVTSPPYFGLRDYGTGTWEGGDLACDHVSPPRGGRGSSNLTPDQRHEKWLAKLDQHNQFHDICGKCGARRIDQQIGLESSPDEWCARLVEVFREVRRVLRPDGVCFVNIGDSYAGSWGNQGRKEERGTQRPINGDMISQVHDGRYPSKGSNTGKIPAGSGLKPKDLIGQPWLLAFALRADGWWLRSEIIWAKPNPMPESVTDRCTKAHEQVFLLTKSPTYYYDQDAVREPLKPGADHDRGREQFNGTGRTNRWGGDTRVGEMHSNPAGRNLRSVWTIATDPLPSIEVDGEKLDHFASYPIELARRCILAGTSAKGCCPECGAPWARRVETERLLPAAPSGKREIRRWDADTDIGRLGGRTRSETIGWRPTCSCVGFDYVEGIAVAECEMPPIPCRVLDPFGGSGRTALAAEELGRDCTLIELNPASVLMARAQLERAKARRMIGDADRVLVPAGQLRFDL